MRKKISFAVIIILTSISWNSNLFGQVQLERISIAERSDGLGYVLRHHLSDPVDSIAISRPEIDKIQMILYAPEISSDQDIFSNFNEVIERIKIFDLSHGLGVEISLHSNQFYASSAYPDQNMRDILVALERKTRIEIESVIEERRDPEILNIKEGDIAESVESDFIGIADKDIDESDEIFPDEKSASQLSDHQSLFERERTTLSLQTLMPGDPFELYVRSILPAGHQNETPSYLLRPAILKGYKHIFQERHRHIWQDHLFFTQFDDVENASNINVFAQEIFYSHNNKRPAGFNDGALWQGRGFNMAITTGVSMHYGPFRAVIRPVFVHSENRDFELSDDPQYPGISTYGIALTNADIPQRFGEEGLSQFDLGDSYIEFEHSGFSGGFSNQRMWTGPAVHNPLMFSTNAPGFLHAFAGTSKPYAIPGGRFEGRLFWGSLRESDYFDENPDNDLRFLTGFVFSYSPEFVPGLYVGMTRVAYSYYGDGLSASDLFMAFRPSPPKPNADEVNPDDVHFSKSSFFIRWAYPRIGFEAYTEWGRNDDRRRIRDLFMEPELNRGYVLGVLQRINVGRWGSVLLNGEITNLENSSVTAQYRDNNIWYANDQIRQGFTHRGQVLGAAIGPGSSTQVASASFYHKYGKIGFSLARVALHNDRLFVNRDYYQSRLPRDWMSIRRLHEIEIRHGLHGLLFLANNFELQFDIYTANIENINNQYDRPRPGGPADDILFDERNVQISFTLRYHLVGYLR